MNTAKETDPARCVMIDDLPHTTRAARDYGMFSLLYGRNEPHIDADACFANWRDLPVLLNGNK
jgi:beta-phosphoglucomutase-like phosphatase (HAD superfamily)